MGPRPPAEQAISLYAQIIRERGSGSELAAEIRRTMKAYEDGRIDERELSDWVGSWEARLRARGDATA
jgi:hypothetical protein